MDGDLAYDNFGDQGAEDLSVCPELPPGVEAIDDLAVAHAYTRFGGLILTLSTRPLACAEPAAQHDQGGQGYGLTVGLPEDRSIVGTHALAHPVYIEFETPSRLSVGGGGDLRNASVELFEITDTCVTGRVIGLEQRGGPFDGGFRAPRCTP